MDDIKSRLKSRMDEPPVDVDEQPMMVRSGRTFQLTAGELREVCDTDPDHPKAQAFAKACRNFPDNHILYVERADLDALMEGKDVVEQREREGGSTVIRKTLISRTEAKREAKKTPDPAHAAVAPQRPAPKGGK